MQISLLGVNKSAGVIIFALCFTSNRGIKSKSVYQQMLDSRYLNINRGNKITQKKLDFCIL